MIKRLGLLVAALLLLAGLLAACADTGSASGNSRAGGPPRIVVDYEVLDYGTVHYNQWVRPNFKIRNEGGSNLVLQKPTVKTLEGC